MKKYTHMKACLMFFFFFIGVFLALVRFGPLYYISHPDNLGTVTADQLPAVLKRMVAVLPISVVNERIRNAFPYEEQWMHNKVGHVLGEQIYYKYGLQGFALCPTFFNMGCHHGLLELVARISGPDPGLLVTLKQTCEATLSNYRYCTHPLGHAVTMLTNYDIRAALALCDKFYPIEDVTPPCWLGAFMEYNDRSEQIASQDRSSMKDDRYIPYESCASFLSKYEGPCVQLHVSYYAPRWKYDYGRLMEYCSSYEQENTVSDCADEVGYIIGTRHVRELQFTIHLCEESHQQVSDACLVGLSRMYRTTGHMDEMKQICPHINNTNLRDRCASGTQDKV